VLISLKINKTSFEPETSNQGKEKKNDLVAIGGEEAKKCDRGQ
jgi:hypothetical protein